MSAAGLSARRSGWDRAKTRRFQRLLLQWYARRRRVLPWREDPDPYKVWVSEIMLQQTQVSTVLPFFESFLARFPDIRSLARATAKEVVHAWSGLGYYGRARNLRRSAGIIVRRHAGRIPADMESLRNLPGIGRYTAGAILSIAFNQRVPIVDGNVRRVIARLHGIEGPVPEDFCWDQAESWIPDGSAAQFNQAVMELGALVCAPSAPRCPVCPIRRLCAAHRDGTQDRIPPPRKARSRSSLRLVMLVAQRRGLFLLARRRAPEYIPGEWGLPTAALRSGESPDDAAALLARRIVGTDARPERRPVVRHAITFRQLQIHVYCLRLDGAQRGRSSGFRWARAAGLSRLLTSAAYRKALRSAAAHPAALPDGGLGNQ